VSPSGVTINISTTPNDRAARRATCAIINGRNDMDGEGISVKKWAAAKSKRHARALGLLPLNDVKTIRRGLASIDKITELERDVAAMKSIEAKLDRIVASSDDDGTVDHELEG
jgi:hypothetical protein